MCQDADKTFVGSAAFSGSSCELLFLLHVMTASSTGVVRLYWAGFYYVFSVMSPPVKAVTFTRGTFTTRESRSSGLVLMGISQRSACLLWLGDRSVQ